MASQGVDHLAGSGPAGACLHQQSGELCLTWSDSGSSGGRLTGESLGEPGWWSGHTFREGRPLPAQAHSHSPPQTSPAGSPPLLSRVSSVSSPHPPTPMAPAPPTLAGPRLQLGFLTDAGGQQLPRAALCLSLPSTGGRRAGCLQQAPVARNPLAREGQGDPGPPGTLGVTEVPAPGGAPQCLHPPLQGGGRPRGPRRGQGQDCRPC